MTGEAAAVVALVAERVLALPRRGHPVRVGVDGRSAAGKTTFADGLAARLRKDGREDAPAEPLWVGGGEGAPAAPLPGEGREVVRAELDHFMRMVADRDAYPYDSPESYYRDAFDLAAIRRTLLEPLGRGGNRRYRDAADAPERTAGVDAILVADGVFLQRPELDAHWDLRIYLDVDLATSLRRGVERDRHWMGSAAVAEDRYRSTYLPGEQRYRAEVRPRERAQIVIDNGDPRRPVISRG